MTLKSLPYILLLGFFYGTTLIASRFTVGIFNANVYVGVRMALAALIHLTFYLFLRNRKFPTDWNLVGPAILLGIFGTAITLTAIVNGVRFVSSGIASIIFTTGPAFTALFAWFILPDERISVRKGAGIVLALGGAVLLFSTGETGLADSSGSLIGYVFLLGATATATFTLVLARKYMKDLDPFDVSTIRMTTAAICVLPISIYLYGFDTSSLTPIGYGAIGWAVLFGTFGAFMLNFYNTTRFGATTASTVSFFVPIFGTLGGWLLLGETITGTMIGGMLVIMLGIGLLREGGDDMPQPDPD